VALLAFANFLLDVLVAWAHSLNNGERSKLPIVQHGYKHDVDKKHQRPDAEREQEPFWSELKSIAAERQVALGHLISMIDANRRQGNLSSALRLFVLAKYRPETIDSRSHPCETDREFTENERPAGRLLCDP
jgi:hypothetical protein